MSSTRRTLVLVLCFHAVYSAEEVDFMGFSGNGKQCRAKLNLSAEYDPLKSPKNVGEGPLDVHVEFDIRQVREVDESKKSYTVDLHIYMYWVDERLIGQTEKTKCDPVFPATVTFWIPGTKLKFNFQTSSSMMLTSVSDLALQSSRNPNKLRDMLSRESHYLIDGNGTVAMWGAASFDLNCKSMDFSYYPYDKHKCEFLIHSDMYTEVNNEVIAQKGYSLRKS